MNYEITWTLKTAGTGIDTIMISIMKLIFCVVHAQEAMVPKIHGQVCLAYWNVTIRRLVESGGGQLTNTSPIYGEKRIRLIVYHRWSNADAIKLGCSLKAQFPC